MALGVELKIQKTDVLFQENPSGKLMIANKGAAPITVHNPTFDPTGLAVKVVEMSTRSETVNRGTKPSWQQDVYQSLTPGQKLEFEYPLSSLAEFRHPGEYRVSAIVDYSGPAGEKGRTESDPVAVKIQPVTPRNLSLAYATGGWSADQYGFSVNAAANPPALVRHTFSSTPEGGGVIDALPGPPVPIQTKPVPSQPGNGKISLAQWVAWLEGSTLNVTHIDPNLGLLPVKQWSVPEPEAELVPPLHIDSTDDPSRRSIGSALLMSELPDGQHVKLQAVHFSPTGEISPGAAFTFDGGRPIWAESHEKSNGSRLVTYAQKVETGWALFAVPWPDSKKAAPAPRKLGEWPGRPLAFGTALTPDDSVIGAVVIQFRRGRNLSIKVATWSMSDKGEFLMQPSRDVPWDPRLPVEQAVVRISPREAVAAILTDGEGRRFVFPSSGKLQVAPGLLAVTKLPLDVAFVGQTDPVLIAAQEGRGFTMVYLNGQPLGHGH
jgi:hypothetical protein